MYLARDVEVALRIAIHLAESPAIGRWRSLYAVAAVLPSCDWLMGMMLYATVASSSTR